MPISNAGVTGMVLLIDLLSLPDAALGVQKNSWWDEEKHSSKLLAFESFPHRIFKKRCKQNIQNFYCIFFFLVKKSSVTAGWIFHIVLAFPFHAACTGMLLEHSNSVCDLQGLFWFVLHSMSLRAFATINRPNLTMNFDWVPVFHINEHVGMSLSTSWIVWAHYPKVGIWEENWTFS